MKEFVSNSWSNLKWNLSSSAASYLSSGINDGVKNISNFTKSNRARYNFYSGYGNVVIQAAKTIASQHLNAELKNLYPKYQKYLEDKVIKASVAKNGAQSTKLISNQEVLDNRTKGMDVNHGLNTIKPKDKYGREVLDALILGIPVKDKINITQSIYNAQSGITEMSSVLSDTLVWYDLAPIISMQSSKNLVITKVQGRDYSRKELISGGDLEFSVSGKIVSGYPDVYPKNDVEKFIQIMQYGGVVNVVSSFLSNFKVTQILIKDFSCNQEMGFKDTQPYSFNCIAVEPLSAVMATEDTISSVNLKITKSPKDGWLKALLDQKLKELKSSAASSAANTISSTLSNTI